MKTKIFAALLVACMILSMVSIAMAAEVLVNSGAEIQSAINSASDGTIIKLNKDIVINNHSSGIIKVPLDTSKPAISITLDLNGHTLSQNTYDAGLSISAIAVRPGSELTIIDSVGGGKISGNTSVIQLSGTLNLESGTIAVDSTPSNTDKNESYRPTIAYPVWFYIANSSVKPVFNMTGGALEIGATQEGFNEVYSLVIDNQYGSDAYGSNVTVNISGGNVEGVVNLGDEADVTISGGTFSEPVPAGYEADGYERIENGDGTYTVKMPDPATPTPATPTPAPAAPVVTAAPAAPAPKTGDNTNIALWMSLMLISGVALLGLRKKASK